MSMTNLASFADARLESRTTHHVGRTSMSDSKAPDATSTESKSSSPDRGQLVLLALILAAAVANLNLAVA